MVVPVSLDPGYNDPRSPYFTGCYRCGARNTRESPCRKCQRKLQLEEARAKQARQEALTQEMLEVLEEHGELAEGPREELPREVAIEEEHRAESAYQDLLQERDADE